MKRISAQYIFTNTGSPLNKGVITFQDDGTISDIIDTGGNLKEEHSLEFHNGIIIPGFVNCHCHLELSHMKDSIAQGSGLGEFISQVRDKRESNIESIYNSAYMADNDMYRDGVVLCADICNTSSTFDIKRDSRIRYINLLEVYGTDPERASHRIDEITRVADKAREMNLCYYIVPHSAYSISLPLLRILKIASEKNRVTSVHFMETEGEKAFIETQSGPLMDSYRVSGLLPSKPEPVKSHAGAILNEITNSGNLLLVHNTFIDRKTVRMIKNRKDLFYCLCPNSNIYIENAVPPVEMMLEEGCEIVVGTDSLASNRTLSILEELITLQLRFPSISIEELIKWGTINGAKALCEEDRFGKIEIGKRPGLLLIQNLDLQNMKLLSDSIVSRVV
jgi:cytosine/adenosine deaminase-related metal-dependent hydrolase